MEIKTTFQIRNKLIPSVSETEANIYWKKEWVALDDIPKEIKKQFGNMDNINMVIKWFESMRS